MALMTPREVAEFLRTSTTQVYRMAKAGRLPFVRISTSIRFDENEIRSLIDAGRVPAVTGGSK